MNIESTEKRDVSEPLYPETLKELTKRICEKFPDALMRLEAADKIGFKEKGEYTQEQYPSYLLWMLQELQKFEDLEKTGTWLGWVLRSLELPPMEIITNNESRALVRADKKRRKEKQ